MRANSSLILLLAFLALAVPNAFSQPCGPAPAVNSDGIGPYNYTDPAWRDLLKNNVERNHFNQDVETLRRGISGPLGGEIDYVLNKFPNHHRALHAMMRLGEKERTARPRGARASVECYLYRAVTFAPEDAVSKLLYGIHLQKLGRREAALEQLTTANERRPDDPNIHYNLGLLYFDAKNYAKAGEHAKRAYALGFPLEGLKNKLKSVGAWKGD